MLDALAITRPTPRITGCLGLMMLLLALFVGPGCGGLQGNSSGLGSDEDFCEAGSGGDPLRGAEVEVDVPPEDSWGQVPQPGESPGQCGDDLETAAWRMANCERQAQGLEPLACDMRLVWLGRLHSQDMIERGYFSHVNPDGEDPFARFARHGLDFWSAAENIALDQSVAGAHQAWMNSPGHRANILHPDVTHAGVGIVDGPQGLILTTLFLKPRQR